MTTTNYMKLTAKEFRSEKNKRLTLLGMSGVGKTHLAKLIGENGGWYHFSGDYHIGATYLKHEIINNIANKMKTDEKAYGPAYGHLTGPCTLAYASKILHAAESPKHETLFILESQKTTLAFWSGNGFLTYLSNLSDL